MVKTVKMSKFRVNSPDYDPQGFDKNSWKNNVIPYSVKTNLCQDLSFLAIFILLKSKIMKISRKYGKYPLRGEYGGPVNLKKTNSVAVEEKTSVIFGFRIKSYPF